MPIATEEMKRVNEIIQTEWTSIRSSTLNDPLEDLVKAASLDVLLQARRELDAQFSKAAQDETKAHNELEDACKRCEQSVQKLKLIESTLSGKFYKSAAAR